MLKESTEWPCIPLKHCTCLLALENLILLIEGPEREEWLIGEGREMTCEDSLMCLSTLPSACHLNNTIVSACQLIFILVIGSNNVPMWVLSPVTHRPAHAAWPWPSLCWLVCSGSGQTAGVRSTIQRERWRMLWCSPSWRGSLLSAGRRRWTTTEKKENYQILMTMRSKDELW